MIFDSTNLMACSDFSVWNILCSFSSFVYHFVNFFNQPLTALRMEYIVELTKMLCYAILFKQIHHILSSHILCLGILLYAERYKHGSGLLFLVHCCSPFCGSATFSSKTVFMRFNFILLLHFTLQK